MNTFEEKRAIMVVREKAGNWRLPSHCDLARVGGNFRMKLRHSRQLFTSNMRTTYHTCTGVVFPLENIVAFSTNIVRCPGLPHQRLDRPTQGGAFRVPAFIQGPPNRDAEAAPPRHSTRLSC